MPGEHAGDADGMVVGCAEALQDLDNKFPEFGHDIHIVQAEPPGPTGSCA